MQTELTNEELQLISDSLLQKIGSYKEFKKTFLTITVLVHVNKEIQKLIDLNSKICSKMEK